MIKIRNISKIRKIRNIIKPKKITAIILAAAMFALNFIAFAPAVAAEQNSNPHFEITSVISSSQRVGVGDTFRLSFSSFAYPWINNFSSPSARGLYVFLSFMNASHTFL